MHALGARVAVVGLVLGLAAASLPAGAAPRPDAPPELLVSAALGPVNTLRGLQAYLEAVAPGAGDGLSDRALRRAIAEALGMRSLDGIDPASWMYLLVVADGKAPAIGLLARVADAKVLATSAGGNLQIKRGWAVIGARVVLDSAGAYALGTLAAQPVPRAPSATVYLPHVLTRYQAEIAAVRQQIAATAATSGPADRMTQMMLSGLDGIHAALGEVDQVVVTVEASSDLLALDLALAPRPRSRFADFVALQRPSDYALLGRLPATTPWAVLAGHLETGPYREGLLALTAELYGPGLLDDLRTTYSALLDATTGDIAMTMRGSPGAGMSTAQLYGVSDPTAANKAIAGMLDLFKAGRTVDLAQISTTIKTLPDAPSHDGVALRGYRVSYDLSKAPPAQRKAMEQFAHAGNQDARIAAFDSLGTVATGPDSVADAGRVIDAARGKAARFVAPPAIAAFLAGSRTRKDSLAMTLDMGALLAVTAGRAAAGGPDAPLLLSLGFADRRAHLRLAAPVASMRAAMLATRP